MLGRVATLINSDRVATTEETQTSFTFTGTNFTNGGVMPFSLNESGTVNTLCNVNELKVTSIFTSVITVWMRYKLATTNTNLDYSFARIISWSNTTDLDPRFSLSYNASDFTQYTIQIQLGGTSVQTINTPSLFDPNNIYDVFIERTTTPSINITFYLNGTLIYTFTGSTFNNTTLQSDPFNECHIFADNVYASGSNSNGVRAMAGRVYQLATLPRILSAAEKSAFSARVLPV